MSHASKHHGHSQPVRRRNHVRIPHRSARLNNCRRPSLGRFLHTIGKRKKRIRGHHATLQRTLRLHHRQFHGIHPAHLSCAHTERRAIFRKYNGVGLHVFRNFPRKSQSAHFFREIGRASCRERV